MKAQEWQTVDQQEMGRRIRRYWIWKVMLSYYTARIDKESGNINAAKAHLRFVAAKGSRTLYAQEARNLLEQIELQEKHTAQM